MTKYNIYIICKEEKTYLAKVKELNLKYKAKICYTQWIPAVYLKLTSCNKKIINDLQTRYNTHKNKILAKLGCIAAHRNALLAIYMNKTNNNIILEEDSILSHKLPSPPKISCYMGGWIVPPQITQAGKKIPSINPKNGLNKINYDKFKILMTHALFIKTHEEAIDLFQTTITDKIKNYDIHLNSIQFFENYYYPPLFVQGKHKSEIDQNMNKNDQYSKLYGI